MRSSNIRDRQKEPVHVSVGQESRVFEMLSLRVPQCGRSKSHSGSSV